MKHHLLAFALALAGPGVASAQAYPSRTVHYITVSAPGNNIVTRIYAEQMGGQFGQPVVVDNRPGGSSMIGAEAGARAAPDGYTLLFLTSGTMIVNQLVIAKVPYDTLKDFVPIELMNPGVSKSWCLKVIDTFRSQRL